MVNDHSMALGQRLMHQMVENHRHIARMVEDGIKLVVEKRQPMFHARKATTFTDRLIKRVIALRRTEHRDVILAETADHVRRKRDFAHRLEHELLACARGTLRSRIESADRFQCVAKEIKPQRLFRAGCIKIENTTTNCKFADVAHGGNTFETVALQPGCQIVHIQLVAGTRRNHLFGNSRLWRQFLQNSIGSREDDRRMRRLFKLGQRAECSQSACRCVCAGRYAVIRQAVPSRQMQNRHIRRHETQDLLQIGNALPVAHDIHNRSAFADLFRQTNETERLVTVGNAVDHDMTICPECAGGLET